MTCGQAQMVYRVKALQGHPVVVTGWAEVQRDRISFDQISIVCFVQKNSFPVIKCSPSFLLIEDWPITCAVCAVFSRG